MRSFWTAALAALCCLVPPVAAEEKPAPAAAKSYEVPYRLTIPKHILIRAKLNGKGPFNFILDTGAPALFVTPAVARKAGVTPDKGSWGTFDRLEIEGGATVAKIKGRIETPFQLEGMNGMGLAGAELHGIIGYNMLARFRMEIDFTRDKMTWTPLDFDPKAPAGLGGRTGGAGGLEIVGSIMKTLGSFLGRKANPDVVPRGFIGIELTDSREGAVVKSVLADGPAAKAGVEKGDRIEGVQGRTVVSAEDVENYANVPAGTIIKLVVTRGKDKKEITFKSVEGF
jgi:hypothetical protein